MFSWHKFVAIINTNVLNSHFNVISTSQSIPHFFLSFSEELDTFYKLLFTLLASFLLFFVIDVAVLWLQQTSVIHSSMSPSSIAPNCI